MESQNTHFDSTLYSGVEEVFDPWFDPKCQIYPLAHPMRPLPFSPSSIWQQHQQHNANQRQQSQQLFNSVANTMAHNLMPFETVSLGFPAAMQSLNPMLATQMNINTDAFTYRNYWQGPMGIAS